ncbi:ribosome biogenesis GTP-binding protein YihA/YsxC [Azospira sp. APE16]|uniref:ribosome biogenesis GTP-binding protein YihA/YsxC n=1 Tax=Azospira sp. APE16 TaxID=3394231 RepID=UPI003A4D6E33
MALFQKAVFLTTVAHLRDLPEDAQAEVAFAGRSNAGKSSAINTLANHTRLAFVSKTPGRTQHLNFFKLEEGKFLVDLPGYGYAKAPEEIRSQWEGLLGPYLQHRGPLSGLVLIMDSRHPLTELDQNLIDWFAATGKPLHIMLSKADKLTRQEQSLVLRQVKAAMADLGERCTVQLFSSLKKTGVEEAEKVIAGWMGMEVPPPRPAPPPRPIRSAKSAAGAKQNRTHAPGNKKAVLAGGKPAKPKPAKAPAQK